MSTSFHDGLNELLGVAAVFGAEFGAVPLGHAADRSVDDVLGLLDEARAAGLIDEDADRLSVTRRRFVARQERAILHFRAQRFGILMSMRRRYTLRSDDSGAARWRIRQTTWRCPLSAN